MACPGAIKQSVGEHLPTVNDAIITIFSQKIDLTIVGRMIVCRIQLF